ncbi:hypothetical protein GTZ99_00445 [Novosphingobium sp. FSY-8]|uniref:Sulfotransferase family protein n=1 Tax=Novosphingobium ovatum TaxID=1908523 RepID=A0ABW9X927_9SPHN|nr:hypothetical protein [Novosphingobium ovatum]NBC35023.1 hypothetical protein [Novosphingobium ovatum]
MDRPPAIWLLSDGRSGSTWLAQVMNHACQFHVEHEPIHARLNPRLTSLPLYPLPSERAVRTHYIPLFQDIRAGAYRTHRFPTEPEADASHGLIIRDIFGLMVAPEMLAALDWLHPVVAARHPADVARSKMALADWKWFTDIESFRADTALITALPDLDTVIDETVTGPLGSPGNGVRDDAATTYSIAFRRLVLEWIAGHAWFFARVDRNTVPVIRYPAPQDRLARQMGDILRIATPDADTTAPSFAAAYQRRSATDRPPDERSLLRRLMDGRRPAPTPADLAWTEAMIDRFGLRWLVS